MEWIGSLVVYGYVAGAVAYIVRTAKVEDPALVEQAHAYIRMALRNPDVDPTVVGQTAVGMIGFRRAVRSLLWPLHLKALLGRAGRVPLVEDTPTGGR